MNGWIKSGPARDFTRVGQIGEPPFVVLPEPGALFARRAARFVELAEGHPLAPCLKFLSRLAAVQDRGVATLPAPFFDAARAERAASHSMPPLSKVLLSEGADFTLTLDWFLRNAKLDDAPPAAAQALARLQAADGPERLALAEAVLDSAYPADKIGECLYVAAALQIYLTRLAAQLDAARLRSVGDGVCPACGGLAAASVIVGRPGAERSRYCCCGLCATQWNYTRIKCTICGSTAGISYRLIEEQSKDVTVETCATCRGYIKHLRQDRSPGLEPFADEIASYGLDLLVRAEGFVRPPATPFMIVAAPPVTVD